MSDSTPKNRIPLEHPQSSNNRILQIQFFTKKRLKQNMLVIQLLINRMSPHSLHEHNMKIIGSMMNLQHIHNTEEKRTPSKPTPINNTTKKNNDRKKSNYTQPKAILLTIIHPYCKEKHTPIHTRYLTRLREWHTQRTPKKKI